MIKTIGVWISKDGDDLDNMSFFKTKKDALHFKSVTKRKSEHVVSGILTFKLSKIKK